MKMMERKAYTAFGETGRYRYSGGCDKNVGNLPWKVTPSTLLSTFRRGPSAAAELLVIHT